ncbi:DUF5698 domain-containing protein [Peribacillus loiseleuriae]|uniref:DUF5698 domain-containing protein n=1 Tax=Peribacillus loiseleuriae TaxID=1679170 RepID=A0A0K9GU42_9BACI|nr:DUF5698 domain-containing protein [Peribacillus loiseleuriae]KMY50165.1 hypothetical protein AC625_12185 [Peribacillus loiseleuriae]
MEIYVTNYFFSKRQKWLASILGFIESLVYVFGLAIIFTGEQSIWATLVYAIGFSVGIAIGGYVEERLAIGYTTIVANITNRNDDFISPLHQEGFGVRLFVGEGKDSKRYKLEILTLRSREKELFSIIQKYVLSAFLISYEASKF